MNNYHLFRIKDPESNSLHDLLEQLSRHLMPRLDADNLTHYGFFSGLFGLAGNEIYWIVYGERQTWSASAEIEKLGLQVVQSIVLSATVRPTVHEPRSRDGLYVFRWFHVKSGDVEHIAELSEQAWVTFEEGFDTQIQGLFASSNRQEPECSMLLITWYKNFAVWEASRKPSVEARDLFMKRHELTLEATPIATRLVRIQ
jgi:hypothetical protein